MIAAMPVLAPSPPPPAEVEAEEEAEILEAIDFFPRRTWVRSWDALPARSHAIK